MGCTRPGVDAPTKRDLATALNGIDNHDAKTLTCGQALENCVPELQGALDLRAPAID